MHCLLHKDTYHWRSKLAWWGLLLPSCFCMPVVQQPETSSLPLWLKCSSEIVRMCKASFTSSFCLLKWSSKHFTRSTSHEINSMYINIQQNHQWFQSRVLMAHNTLNGTMSPWAWCIARGVNHLCFTSVYAERCLSCLPQICIMLETMLLKLHANFALGQGWRSFSHETMALSLKSSLVLISYEVINYTILAILKTVFQIVCPPFISLSMHTPRFSMGVGNWGAGGV